MFECFGYYMMLGYVAALITATGVTLLFYLGAIVHLIYKHIKKHGFVTQITKAKVVEISQGIAIVLSICLMLFYTFLFFGYHVYLSGLFPCPS